MSNGSAYHFSIGALLTLSAACVQASAPDFEIVSDGTPKASVVLAGDRQIDADVAFFTNAVFRSTGASLPVVAQGLNAKGSRIVFNVEQRGMFTEDDWAISFPNDETLAICGTAQSCRWALNWLLEDRLGIVFCLPGLHGTHYPHRTAFTMPRKPASGTASLKVERTLCGEDAAWMRSLGGKEQLPGRQFYNHNMHNIFPPAKYAEDPWRERIMPLLKGRRSKPAHKNMFWQPCFSAADCVPESVKNIRSYLDAHPGERAYSLTMNDCGGYCECDGCKALNGGTLDAPCRFGSGKTKCRSTVYFNWANAVAREIAKSHPLVVLGILAYGETIDPPPFRLEPNLLVFLCASIYQNGDRRISEKRLGLMRAWSEKVSAFGVWDYPYGPASFIAPRIYTKRIGDFFALKNGTCPALNAYFGEGAATFVGEGPKRYLYMKGMFDTNLDVAATLDAWYRACVGEEASSRLRAYYELWEGFWCGEAVKATKWYKTIDNTYMGFREKSYIEAVTPELIDRADALAEEAHAAAIRSGDAEQKIRAERLYAFHRFYSERMRACGVGPEERAVTSEDAAERFFRAFPSMARHIGEAGRLVERIRELDEPEGLPRYALSFASFRRNASMYETFEEKMNDAAGYARTPAVAGALRDARDAQGVPGLYRELLTALSGKRGLPLLVAEDANPETASAAWIRDSVYGVTVARKEPDGKGRGRTVLVATSKDGSWPAVARVVRDNQSKASHYFRFAARVKNVSSAKLRVRMCRDALGMLPVSCTFEVEPGETRTMAVVGQTAYKGGYDRFFLIFNGLPKGESVEIEGLSLDDAGRP